MEDLSSWLTIPQMAEATGKSIRSIERLITKQKITVAKRPVEGHKPITVIAPDEVEKQKAIVLRPTVQPHAAITPTRQPDKLPANTPIRQADMQTILKALERLRVPLSQQVYLTEKEAALFLGFSEAEVKRIVKAKAIPTIRLRDRRVRIARKDLEHYTPPLVGVTVWRNGKEQTTQ